MACPDVIPFTHHTSPMTKTIWPGGLLLVVLCQTLARPVHGEDDPSEAHWGVQGLQRPSLPSVVDGRRARVPLDRFILSRLASKGLSFSPDAARVTLVRRAWRGARRTLQRNLVLAPPKRAALPELRPAAPARVLADSALYTGSLRPNLRRYSGHSAT